MAALAALATPPAARRRPSASLRLASSACPPGGALPAAHDPLGGRMGARAARDPARPGGGAGEDAARERLAGGLLGMLTVRHARGEACLRAPGASPRGRAPRRASTGAAEPASRGPHGEVRLPPDPEPGAGSGFSDGWERASDSGEGREGRQALRPRRLPAPDVALRLGSPRRRRSGRVGVAACSLMGRMEWEGEAIPPGPLGPRQG